MFFKNLYYKSVCKNGAFFQDNNSIFNNIQRMVGIRKVVAAIDANIITNPTVFIDNGILYIAAIAYANLRNALTGIVLNFGQRFIIIVTHDVTAYNRSSMPQPAAYSNHAVLNATGIDDRTLSDDGFLQRCSADFCRG
jgi:hypothetical protein